MGHSSLKLLLVKCWNESPQHIQHKPLHSKRTAQNTLIPSQSMRGKTSAVAHNVSSYDVSRNEFDAKHRTLLMGDTTSTILHTKHRNWSPVIEVNREDFLGHEPPTSTKFGLKLHGKLERDFDILHLGCGSQEALLELETRSFFTGRWRQAPDIERRFWSQFSQLNVIHR